MSGNPTVATARRRPSSARGWALVVVFAVIPPLWLFAPAIMAALGYIRVRVAILATGIPVAFIGYATWDAVPHP